MKYARFMKLPIVLVIGACLITVKPDIKQAQGQNRRPNPDYGSTTPIPKIGRVTIRRHIRDLPRNQIFAQCPTNTRLVEFAESTNYSVMICSDDNKLNNRKYWIQRHKATGRELRLTASYDIRGVPYYPNGSEEYYIYTDGARPERMNAYLSGDSYEALLYHYNRFNISEGDSVDSVFRSTLSQIQRDLPHNLVMRLPASLEVARVNRPQNQLYSSLAPLQNNEFRVSITTTADCQSRFCGVGYLATYTKNAKADQGHLSFRNSSSAIPVNLAKGISGAYIYVDSRGASSGPYQLVIWEQDNQIYMISFPYTDSLSKSQNQRYMVDTARSMSTRPPIYSSRSVR